MDAGQGSLLSPADLGCLLIADVSGYTAYLGGTELEHAEDVLADLTETIVGHLRPPLEIAKLEGDAVFAYALDDGLGASMLLDTVERTYIGFRSRSRDVARATRCDCGACRLIPSLDLKFVVHHGRFVRREVAGTEELTGSDVVIVHRLLKNTVVQELDAPAYALFTDACVRALDMDPDALGLAEHREQYDDVGEVVAWVEDLHERWRIEEERRRVYVPTDEAEFEVAWEFPVAAPVLWDYQTSPEKRLLWQIDFSRIDQSNPNGRRGAGTTNHCVHGRGVVVEEILDWRPYRYFTVRTAVPGLGPWTFTFEFVELAEDRTELRVRTERLRGWRRLLWTLMRRPMMSNMSQGMGRLEQLLETDASTPEPVS